MSPVPRRNFYESGFVHVALIKLLVIGCVYSCYGSIMLAVANRLQPSYAPTWWVVVLGPFAVCYLAASFYGLWCRRKGVATAPAFLNATILVIGLELLLILLGFGWLVWYLLIRVEPG